MILGIDEVGRGPWAGPLLVGAVVWPDSADLDGLTDSKKLSTKKRKELNKEIKLLAIDYTTGEVSPQELDEIGQSASLRLATIRAVEKITAHYDQIIIDGTVNFLSGTPYQKKVSTLVKADLLVPAVSAASILAKVKRDNYMIEQALEYPQYGFETNVGYGTPGHQQAIDEYGVTPLHRLSIKPLKRFQKQKKTKFIKNSSPTTKAIGDRAEEKMAEFLRQSGHFVLARNFKTKWCEIDIVSLKNKTIYFTEVKYRKNDDFGGAIQSIGEAKQKQMSYASEIFMNSGRVNAKNLSDYQQQLAVGLVGSDFTVSDWFTLER